jgi:hypothetical protein
MLSVSAGAGCVYGLTEIVGQGTYGRWPPAADAFTDGAYLLRASLGYRYDPESWRRDIIADYDLRSRLVAEVKMAFVDEIVYRYWPAHKVPST